MHMRKGMGVSTILGLALSIGVLLVVGVSVTSGSLGQSLDEGFGILENRTDYSIELVNEHGVSAEKRLSDAAMYVYHRASQGGCAEGGPVDQQIQGGGYPGLQGTYLTQTPKCAGVTESFVRGGIWGQNPMETPGQDEEGIFSRVYFHVPETREDPVVLDEETGDLWLEKRLLAGGRGNIMKWSIETCNHGYIQELIGGVTDAGSFLGEILPGNPETEFRVTYQGTRDQYVFFFPAGAGGGRVEPDWIGSKGLEHSLYCTEIKETWGIDWDGPAPPVEEKWNDVDMKITLCPGDRGYIQVNKGKAEGDGPRNEGESGVSITDEAPVFPHIQIIRSPNPSC